MVQIHSPRPLLSLRSLAHSVHTFLFCLELPWLRLWIPRSYESDASGLGLFCEVHCCRICCFLSSCLVSGIQSSGFVESGPCHAV
jgi:hypothetical protein